MIIQQQKDDNNGDSEEAGEEDVIKNVRSTIDEKEQNYYFLNKTRWNIKEKEAIIQNNNNSTNGSNSNNITATTSTSDCNIIITYFNKNRCEIDTIPCNTWLTSKEYNHSIDIEKNNVELATIPISAYEINSKELSEISINYGVNALNEYGYCIIPNQLNKEKSIQYGETLQKDLSCASKILKENDNINIYNPYESLNDIKSYKELSMREDYRIDIRYGPNINKLRTAANFFLPQIIIPVITKKVMNSEQLGLHY